LLRFRCGPSSRSPSASVPSKLASHVRVRTWPRPRRPGTGVARSVVKRATSVVARSWGSRARLRELATMAASSAADDDARRVGDKRGFRRQVGGNCVVEVEGEVGLDSQVGQPVPRARPGGLAAGICTPCCKGWHRFQASFRWAWFCAFWRLGLRQSSFRHITRAHRLLAPYAWARETARMACYCPLRLSVPGRPLGPGISPPIPPHCVGDISGRLVAQSRSPVRERATTIRALKGVVA
jgi:hypothetical protein